MRKATALLACTTLALVGTAAAAWAAPPVPPPGPWPPVSQAPAPSVPAGRGLPVGRSVPVPDVRGMTEAQAAQTLARAGLALGGAERVAVDALEQELGRRYEPGIVVQQAPPPSAGDTPSWLPPGAAVWLRMAAGTPTPGTPRAAPLQPVPPTGPVVRPLVRAQAPYTPLPTRPAPTYPAVRQPLPGRPPSPPPYVALPPTPQARAPARTLPDPYAAPLPPIDRDLIGPLTTRFRLPCERGRETWHVRVLGGGAFAFGDDEPGVGPYAGLDFGHTFGGCVGIDAFYRYTSTRFDRLPSPGTVEDGGDTHHAGVKLTYESSLNRESRFFVWMGLGGTWFKTRRLIQDDDGFGFFGEGGLGYLLSDGVRARLGINAHAFETSAGRQDPAQDGRDRWLWTLAPTLGLEIGL